MFVTARCGSSSEIETPLGEACAKIFASYRRNGFSESDALEQAQNFRPPLWCQVKPGRSAVSAAAEISAVSARPAWLALWHQADHEAVLERLIADGRIEISGDQATLTQRWQR
jgi:hypothetical protein